MSGWMENWRAEARRAGGRALDLLYPRSCAACGGDIGTEQGALCWECLAAIPFVQRPFCSLCGDPVAGNVGVEYVCYLCAENRPHFNLARSAARYRGVVGRLLQDFKYNQALWVRRDLARLLTACVRNEFEAGAIDAVTYVPLFHARQRERGYNQAGLLAAALARDLGRPLVRAARRIRPTATQTHFNLHQRAENVKGAFRSRRTGVIEGRRLLLVDDVMTTGATVSECARALKEGGAACVWVATVARG